MCSIERVKYFNRIVIYIFSEMLVFGEVLLIFFFILLGQRLTWKLHLSLYYSVSTALYLVMVSNYLTLPTVLITFISHKYEIYVQFFDMLLD